MTEATADEAMGDAVGETASDAAGAGTAPATVAKRGRGRQVVAVLAIVGAAVLGARYVQHARLFEETDDAQVDGELATVSPRISGTITKVLVVENQLVKAGDPLAELDTADLEVALLQAKANLAQAEAQLKAEDPSVAMTETSNGVLIATSGSDVAGAAAELAGAQADRQRFIAQLALAEANLKLAKTELERSQKLADSGASSGADLDQKSATYDAAVASVEAAKQGVKAAEEKIAQSRARIGAAASRQSEAKENAPRQVEVKRAMVDVRKANVAVAKAQVAQAELNLKYAKIVAPVSGIVGKKSISVGDRVQPGQALMAITQVDDLYVTANFRETQLRDMQAGQHATVHVDALDRDFEAHVESLPGATGAKYSLMPPENATGNYVKVVQRLPVRLRLEAGQSGLDRLRVGMSVEPEVKVR